MDLEMMILRLERQAHTIRSLADGVSPEQAAWKPEAESWSILEVINHLADEEREDFRSHLNTLLHDPQGEWHPIDPMGWVSSRGYNQRELIASLEQFTLERQQSLAWLRSLASPDWDLGRQAPWGLLRAGDMLAAWAAHDLLHTRQLVELHWAHGRTGSEPYSVQYAGDW
jgi:hypothetical protein